MIYNDFYNYTAHIIVFTSNSWCFNFKTKHWYTTCHICVRPKLIHASLNFVKNKRSGIILGPFYAYCDVHIGLISIHSEYIIYILTVYTA